jgi:cystathionine beta-lyase/cystathionine gamma-synthase
VSAVRGEARQMAGISDGLLRLSIGLEHLDDLIADMKKGFGA